MIIEDQCGILEMMVRLAREEENREHGALAAGNIVYGEGKKIYRLIDYCMVDQVGGAEEAHQVIIPAKLSYVFLQNCRKEGNVPVILHTHGISRDGALQREVSFSPPDMRFMESFSRYAAKTGSIPECLFIVTDGETAAYCRWRPDTMDYSLEKERIGVMKNA